MAPHVTVYEVGPRDGLQNEPAVLSVEQKLELIAALCAAGLRNVEAGSFVSPRWIPALADSGELVSRLPRPPGVRFVALVPNVQGLSRLREALARSAAPPPVDAALFVSASETHNRKNVNKGIDETLAALVEVAAAARQGGVGLRGYVSMAWGCPYEGAVSPARVVEIARRLLELGCGQVSLGDTVGVGTPNQTRDLLERLLGPVRPEQLALHLHDTRGGAQASVLVGLEAGITTFDSSIGGLGGCPYAPGASGNLATEDLVYLLRGMGYETGIDWDRLLAAGALAQELVGRRLPGKTLQAELATRSAGRTPPNPLRSV